MSARHGFGMTIFRASVFEKLSKPWFWEKPDPNGGWSVGRIDADDVAVVRSRSAPASEVASGHERHGQRQRNLDEEAGALPEDRFDVDHAADLIHVGADDIHADAAARHAGHFRCRGEARGEDQLLDLGAGVISENGNEEPVEPLTFEFRRDDEFSRRHVTARRAGGNAHRRSQREAR